MAIVLSILILSLYFYVIYQFSRDFWINLRNIANPILRVSYFVTLLIPGGILTYILKREQYVYFWDYSNYWEKSISFTQYFFDDPLAAVDKVYYSIRNDEYNSLANLFLAPIQKLLSPLDYNTYVFSIYLIFFLPFVWILSSFVFKNYKELSVTTKLLLPICIVFFTPLLIPIRYGFVDIIGIVWMMMIFQLLLKTNYLKNLSIKDAIFIGILLLLVVFSRRFYAFWVVSFFAATFLLGILSYIKDKNKKDFINLVINLSVAGIVSLAILLLFFYPFFEMSVLKDYTDIYSAYRGRTLNQEVNYFINFFGLFIILISLIGFWMGYKRDKNIALFLSIFTLLTVVLFTRINDFGYQHFYLVVPFFIIFFLEIISFSQTRKTVTYTIVSVLLINNILVFAYNDDSSKTIAFSNIKGKAFFRAQYKEVLNLHDYVIELKKQNKSVYCLSSGFLLNDSTLKTASLPNGESLTNLFYTQHVNKKDHFPNELLIADYVITTNPIDLHLGESNQHLITYFNHNILNGILKNNYKVVKTFMLENQTEALVLERITYCNKTQINHMIEYFKNLYPDYDYMYKVNPYFHYLSDIKSGDNYGGVNFIENFESIMIHPGSSIPTEITFDFDSSHTQLSFLATFNDKGGIINNCNPDRDGEVFLKIITNDSVIHQFYVTHKEDIPIYIDLHTHKKLTLSVDKGKNEDYCDWFKITNFQLK